jgi:hypothetical protein
LILIASVVALIASLMMAARSQRATAALVSGAVGVVGMVIGIFSWLGFVYLLLLLLGLVAIILGFLTRREGGRAITGAVLGAFTPGIFLIVFVLGGLPGCRPSGGPRMCRLR